jgi:transposase
MEILYPRCCGLDVHKKSVVVCRLTPGPTGQPLQETRTFGTMTDELLALSDWLTEAGVTHVAMESTGVYWKPIYNLLEGSFELLVVNAAHLKIVPGRKTDVQDAEWIATLLRHGLLKGSFIPDRRQRELRELTRYRTCLVRERAAEINRVQKTLEGANIKLASVASDLMGVSGREILAALVAGQTDATRLAQLARGKLREKIPELERALVGCVGSHQRFLLAQQLAHLDDLDKSLEAVSAEVVKRLAHSPDPSAGGGPSQSEAGPEAEAAAPEEAALGSAAEEAIARLITIPGVGRRTAETLVAEIGTEMSRFPSPGHLASWAGLVPGQNESAGKRKSSKTRKGSPWLRAALVEAAQAAGRTKGTYLAAQYERLKGRHGKKKAAVAVGHTLLVIVYHLLKNGTSYEELGGNYFEERDRSAIERRLVRQLERMGNKVTIEPLAA